MIHVSTFYLSRILGKKVFSEQEELFGKIKEVIVDVSFIRPKLIAMKLKIGNTIKIIDFSNISIAEKEGRYVINCEKFMEIDVSELNTMYLVKNVLDKQIVDMYGRKVVRVNDLRLATLSNGTYVVAVDVGLEGLLRRLAIAKQIKKVLKPFGKNVPGKLILWEEVETIGVSNTDIKLSKPQSKLSTLHPSDLADIIEDLDDKTQAAIFASLDQEKAADVLEELDTDAQINILESLSVERAADVLELMPADEVADILDEMEEDKAEELLSEMEEESSDEVRELMEYADNTVGSLMNTDYISFNQGLTVDETINELRKQKPESDTIYYLYVIDDDEKLVSTVSLRDIVISDPNTRLYEIMNKKVIYVYDNDKIDTIAEIISKYSLLAVPVVGEDMKMLGMVVIDDIVYDLLKRRKRKA